MRRDGAAWKGINAVYADLTLPPLWADHLPMAIAIGAGKPPYLANQSKVIVVRAISSEGVAWSEPCPASRTTIRTDGMRRSCSAA